MSKDNTVKLNITPERIRQIYAEYTFDTSDILNYDDDTKTLFDAYNMLTEPEKIVLQLYAETSSQRKTAKLLNVSRTSIVKFLNEVRQKIFDNRNKILGQ